MKFYIIFLAAFYNIGLTDAVGEALCGPILTGIYKAVDAALPMDLNPKCKCAAKADSFFKWITLRFYFDVACSAKVCVDDLNVIPGFEQASDAWPIVGNYCVEPTSGAKMNPLNKKETITCSGASSLILNVTRLEEMTGRNISDQTQMPVSIPNICITLDHKASRTMNELKSCAVTIDGKNCNCTVCAEGTGIQLSCQGLIDEYLPEEFDYVLVDTEKCISSNMMSSERDMNPLFPFLQMVKPNVKP